MESPRMGALLVHLSIPESHSLKDKRRILKSLKDRLRQQYNVSVAETGDLDKWQRAQIGICCISNQTQHVQSSLQSCENFISSFHSVILLEAQIEIL